MKRAQMSSLGVAFIRATGTLYPEDQRLIADPYAKKLLPSLYRFFLHIMRSPKWFKKLIDLREKTSPGLMGWMFCRTRYIDDILALAIKNKEITAVVNLGAGLDTRAYRIPGIENISFYEVDHPSVIEYKKSKIKKILKEIPNHVTFVPIDFDKQSLSEELEKAGYTLNNKTLFVWEGVTQYISKQANESTLSYISRAAPKSQLLFTYIIKRFIDGSYIPKGQEKMHSIACKQKNPLWIHGYDQSRLADDLSFFSLELKEDVGSKEFTERYIKPAHLDLSVFEIERVAHVEVIKK